MNSSGTRLLPLSALRFLFLSLAVIMADGTARAADPLQLRDGDRVVLIGDGLIEQEQYFGWIEVMMTTAFPEADVTYRNLGWNGDTPAGDSRYGLSLVQAGHEPAGEGWRQLEKQLELTRPTVAVLGYGMANALETSTQTTDAAKVQSMVKFTEDLQRLAERIRQIDPKCRLVFLSPISPVGPSVVTSEMVNSYGKLIAQVCDKTGGHDVDLTGVAASAHLRKDPVHLNSDGYKAAAVAIGESLGIDRGAWQDSPQTEALRHVVLEKNRLWFHRSRPANMAYVFGFRKHEQGQNAVEIPQFDPLIEQEEAKIASLRQLTAEGGQEPAPRLESKYAEFTPQPTPDFVVADGLEVSLWAENPMLNKPIHMNFDPQGRLWIASSEAYPMIEVGQAMPDKVLVLEDSNHDGTADKSTVFADGLLIPTGIAPGDGGVYVAQSTDLLFLEDTDGDGKADRRERVLSGFGTEDTHHNLHTLLFGPDGRLYMNQSVYTRTDAETPHGVVRLKAGGGFRFDTRHRRMDVFFRGLWNPWGHQFDALGNSFMSDGAGFAGIAYVFPGARFNPTPGTRQKLDLISPGNYPKFCGGEIVYGESFPEDWQGSLVTCDFRANRVTRFSLSETESGFVTTQEADLIRTSASTFRPIDIKQGPDGALYIADWSNPIINHGEVDFRDPRRDRWHGRIWRVTAKGHPLRKPVDLTEQKTETLIENLYSGDRYLTDQSRRVLIERGEETATKLDRVWSSAKARTDRLAAARLAAAVGEPNSKWLQTLLDDPNGGVRAAATRILADWSDPTDPRASVPRDQAMAWFADRIADPHPRARLEAIRGLAKLGGVDAIRLSLRALDQPTDRFIQHALFLNVDENTAALIKDLRDPVWSAAEYQKQLEFVLTSVQPAQATEFLAGYLADNNLPRDGSGPWIGLIAKAGSAKELTILYQHAIGDKLNDATTAEALTALQNAKRLRRLTPKFQGQPADDLKPLVSSSDAAVQAAAIELCGTWQLRKLIPTLTELAADEQLDLSTRSKAVGALRSCGGEAAIRALVSLLSDDATFEFKAALVAALAGTDGKRAVQPFYDTLAGVEDEASALTLWRAMLSAKDGEALLVGTLPADGVSEVAARAGVRAAREGGRNAQALIDALMPMSGLTMTADKWTPERSAQLRKLVATKGDPARGEMIYRRSSLQCASCHAIGGVGGKVGPDMTSLGASAPVDYIIESMFDPNAKIKENYHAVTVLTEDGQVYSGIESGSTDEEMVLRDATNKQVRIPEAEILQVKPGKSLMPAGLLDRVSLQDQLDLIRFLTMLGKPGEYDASRQTVARVLEVFAGSHRIEQQGNQGIVSGERTEGWKPLQARVSGKIEKATLEALTAQPRHTSLVNIYLRTQVEVGSDTAAEFSIDNIDRANVWVDGQAAGTIDDPIKLSPGKHTVLFQIDGRGLPESITIRSEQVTFISE
ncbi:PVC-type heme-binding CxxCH protein [Stieleria mannarensis]|uniref:PVC-type heme-binding CxxCH protein n=1 Tax=Stieleria mannarensis TaxID=2755585 RepID=UPI0015FF9BD1|nr:PVC-type heme-binding CxxCH protein [Rhodopirellula sp. JC639]